MGFGGCASRGWRIHRMLPSNNFCVNMQAAKIGKVSELSRQRSISLFASQLQPGDGVHTTDLYWAEEAAKM